MRCKRCRGQQLRHAYLEVRVHLAVSGTSWGSLVLLVSEVALCGSRLLSVAAASTVCVCVCVFVACGRVLWQLTESPEPKGPGVMW